MKTYKGQEISKSHTTMDVTRYAFGKAYTAQVFLYNIRGTVNANCYDKLSTLQECRNFINDRV